VRLTGRADECDSVAGRHFGKLILPHASAQVADSADGRPYMTARDAHPCFDAKVFGPGIFGGKTAFIAGGTSGINLGIARALAACGARIAVLGRDSAKAASACAELTASGAQALGLTADVRDFQALDSALQVVVDQWGPLDLVIAGAAGNFIAPAQALSPNGFKAVVDIDLAGTFHTFRAAFPRLRRPGASLLAISSGQAMRPIWGRVHASAAKAGIESLVRTLALEWGPAGVRVNSLCPGPVAGTEGVGRLISDQQAELIAARIPSRRYARLDEVANAAIFLLSSAASYITGTTLMCDGGLLLSAYDGQPEQSAFTDLNNPT
jgi:NAD(P)-dependent dehydrogenase (short-subunit alcohol dehydrogenase family)